MDKSNPAAARDRAWAVLCLCGGILIVLSFFAPRAQARPDHTASVRHYGHAWGWDRHHEGPYAPHDVGEPSDNGSGEGNATGEPCAGCVGNADDKNPPGQLPGGGDHNNGYECDGNQGITRTNPAHSSCSPTTTTTQPPPTTTTTEPATTTTTAPPTTTTTEPPATTTTAPATTTTVGAAVLGVQEVRDDTLAKTGGFLIGPLFAFGLWLEAAGACLWALQVRRRPTS